jgi:hypothetical protein
LGTIEELKRIKAKVVQYIYVQMCKTKVIAMKVLTRTKVSTTKSFVEEI